MSSRFKGGLFAGLGAFIVASLVVIGASAASTSHRAKSKFTKHDRALIARQAARGVPTVSLLIATPRGRTASVSKNIRELGGKLAYRNNRLGYIRASVPVRKADQASRLAGIQTINFDSTLPLPDPTPDGTQPPSPQIPPDNTTPRVNAYMPTRDTGAAQFVNQHPNLDGRGVTVGILDLGVDLDHPSLNTTSTGARKISDWVTYTAPGSVAQGGDGDPTWRDMQAITPVNVVGGQFDVIFGGVNTHYTGVAQDGTYRVARMIESSLGAASEFGIGTCSDLNRDGDCTDFFAILWRESDDTVYVDSQNDRNFTSEPAMHDYKVNYDVNRFGTDNPATPVREAVPFVVQVDAPHKFVNIGIVSGAHGSHVAGITAGNRLFNGEMSGAAPGAKIVSVRVCLFTSGCTSHALIEGMIYVIETDHVDVVNMSIGGLPALNDGNNTRAVLYNRLIEDNNAQMFISAGNSGGGENTIGDPAVASKVMAVGAYITKETWQKNYGSDANFWDNLHPFSSRGPAEDGAFKPEIVAPGAAVSSVPTWQVGQPVAGVYTLPPGYGMFNGTSMAAPQATGAAALLLSAAKQQNRSHTAAQLRMAFNSTARYLSGYNAADQGNGLIDVARAWELLKDNPQPVNIKSRVAVHTLLSDFLAEPGFGPGIYDREGVTVGQRYTRTYTFTRTSGPNRPVLYHLRWVGNDGTFSSQNNLLLRLNVPTTLNVTVNPQTSGIHSAILRLDNSSTDGLDYETMNTVVAPDVFTAANGYSVTKTGLAGRNHVQHFFFRMPAGNPVFKVDMSGPDGTPGTGQVRFLRFHPWGLGIDSNASTSCYAPPVAGCATGSQYSRTVSDAAAGVWEVTVEARRTSDVAWAPFTLTASLYGVSITPNPDVIPTAQINVPVPRSYSLHNNFGTFTGRAVGSNLGSARRGVFTIANHAQQTYITTIPAGSTSFRAMIGGPSDAAADLDLFVYQCGEPACTSRTLRGQSADGDSEESVTIPNPAAGTWLVLVDGYAVPAGTTTYNYVDIFANAALGTVAVTDVDAVHPGGSTWNVNGSVTAGAVPEAGRVLLGSVSAVTTGGDTIGRADVIVQNVTP
ncbi:MAG: S8 family serine peptidase [Actinomycetota bacterium]